jgi:hypothetical protein
MRNDLPRDAYWDAFNEASSELQKIFGEVERLRVRQDRVKKLVEVLNKRFGFHAHIAQDPITWASEYEGLSVSTRINVVQTKLETDD